MAELTTKDDQARPRALEAHRRMQAHRLPQARRQADLRPHDQRLQIRHQPRGEPAPSP